MKDVIEREKLVRETLKAEYDAKEAEKQAVENEENTGDFFCVCIQFCIGFDTIILTL